MRRLLGIATLALFAIIAMTQQSSAADPENTLYLELKSGRVVIEMRPDIAPKHVKRIKELVREKFYDGQIGRAHV